MNKSIGVILGVATLVILVVFFLFDSSKRDMIIGKWEYRKHRIAEFYDDGTAMRYFVIVFNNRVRRLRDVYR